MALKRERRRRRASITSLIDVIFLLLLFFMLSSTFSRFSELEIASVSQGDSTSTAPQVELVTLDILPDAIMLNGIAVQEAELISSLSSMLTSDQRVSVNVGDTVSTQRMIDMLVQLNAVEAVSIQLVEPT